MGHLHQGNIAVKVGERITDGQPIAPVGNSGASSARHVHIQAQTLPAGITDITTIDGPRLLKTLRTYPLLFRGASLVRGGNESWPTAVDPRRGDFVRP
jgi:murein DD-endopeptidase MepM/ murein hydrolase activator NlpD